MSPGFLIGVLLGGLGVGMLANLCCRDRHCFSTNVLAAAVGAFLLASVTRRMGIGYAEFTRDFETSLFFSLGGAFIALLFTMMARELVNAKKSPLGGHSQSEAAASRSRHERSRRTLPRSVCGEFQSFLQGGPG